MVRLTFTGDIMIEREHLRTVGTDHDFAPMLAPLAEVFSKSDYLIGNLETPVAGQDMVYSERLYSFNTPDTVLDALKSAGFNVLTLANNHCLDRGVAGLERTVRKVTEKGFAHVGAYADSSDPHFAMLQVGEKKVALVSNTYGTNSAFNGHMLGEERAWMVDLLSPQQLTPPYAPLGRWYKYNIPLRAVKKLTRIAKRIKGPEMLFEDVWKHVAQARQAGADFVVALPHIGGQYSVEPPRYSRTVVSKMLANGIDMVIGNHEHVIERAEWRKHKFAAYCLGNFTCYPASESASRVPAAKELRREVSVIVHADFEDGAGYPRMSFVPVKNVVGADGMARVYALYDLIKNAENDESRQALLGDNDFAVRRFTGKNDCKVVLQKEYIFNEQ